VASFDSDAIAIFARNTTTGALTWLDGLAGCVSEDGSGGCADGKALVNHRSIAVSPNGKHVYVASQSSSAVAVFARTNPTAALTQLDGLAGA
jgi:6-phosphogluconolactonase (cycloisomerase 2 family)